MEAIREPFESLNDVLRENGAAPHQEPLDVADDQIFDAQMWGYSGLQTVRRLAAYHVIELRLPKPGSDATQSSKDPVLARIYANLFRPAMLSGHGSNRLFGSAKVFRSLNTYSVIPIVRDFTSHERSNM